MFRSCSSRRFSSRRASARPASSACGRRELLSGLISGRQRTPFCPDARASCCARPSRPPPTRSLAGTPTGWRLFCPRVSTGGCCLRSATACSTSTSRPVTTTCASKGSPPSECSTAMARGSCSAGETCSASRRRRTGPACWSRSTDSLSTCRSCAAPSPIGARLFAMSISVPAAAPKPRGIPAAHPDHLVGMGGWDASWLWRRGRDGDRAALRLFAEYNLYDVVNLRTLMAYAYNALVEVVDFPTVRALAPRLDVPERGDLLYDVSKILLGL